MFQATNIKGFSLAFMIQEVSERPELATVQFNTALTSVDDIGGRSELVKNLARSRIVAGLNSMTRERAKGVLRDRYLLNPA